MTLDKFVMGEYRMYGILSTVTGVTLLAYSAFSHIAAVDFQKKAISVPGIINKTTYQQNWIPSGGGIGAFYNQPSSESTIQFETKQGKITEFKAHNVCNYYSCKQTKLQVLYDPENPQKAMVRGGLSPFVLPNGIGIKWGLFFTLCGLSTLVLSRRNS